MQSPDVRWKQRFENFTNAYKQLSDAVELSHKRRLSKLEEQGLIQSFEYTFELAWNTLKDYLKHEKVDVKFPRDTIKKGFQYDLIDDGEKWLDMLDKRNLLAHTYDEANAKLALELIKTEFYPQIQRFFNVFQTKYER